MVDTSHNSLEKTTTPYRGSHPSTLTPSFPWIKALHFRHAIGPGLASRDANIRQSSSRAYDINLHAALPLSPHEGFQLIRFRHMCAASLPHVCRAQTLRAS